MYCRFVSFLNGNLRFTCSIKNKFQKVEIKIKKIKSSMQWKKPVVNNLKWKFENIPGKVFAIDNRSYPLY